MAYIGQNADGNFTTSVSKDTFSGNGSTTAFTLSEGATTNTVDVFVENIRQEPTTAYTVDGTTLTFTAAPVTGTNNIYVVNRGPIQLSASHPAAQALTAHSATITTDLTVDTNTLYVNSTNNRVGIGTTSADEVLEVSGDIKSSGSNFGIYHFGETSDVTKIVGRDAGHASFPNIMDFFTDSTQRMRIDSSGRLLVGKTTNAIGTAGHTLQADGFFSATRSAAYVAGFNRLSDNGDIVQFFKDGTAVGSIGIDSGGFLIDGEASHTGLRFKGGAVTPRLNGAQADNTVGLGNASERFSNLYLGSSLYIGGTGSANALDDYEEGTFTPIYTGTSNPTITYDTQQGEYVKIGRQVIARIELKTDAVSGGSGTLFVEGLPFTAGTHAGSRAGSLIVGYSHAFVTEHPQTGYINAGVTQLQLMVNQSSDAQGAISNNLGVSNLGTTTNDNHLMATLIYTV